MKEIRTVLYCTFDHSRNMLVNRRLPAFLAIFALVHFSQTALTCNLDLLFVTSCMSRMRNLYCHLINTWWMKVLLAFSYAFNVCLWLITISTNLSVGLLNLRRSHHQWRLLYSRGSRHCRWNIRDWVGSAFCNFMRLLRRDDSLNLGYRWSIWRPLLLSISYIRGTLHIRSLRW